MCQQGRSNEKKEEKNERSGEHAGKRTASSPGNERTCRSKRVDDQTWAHQPSGDPIMFSLIKAVCSRGPAHKAISYASSQVGIFAAVRASIGTGTPYTTGNGT